jgi:hypothetical protein
MERKPYLYQHYTWPEMRDVIKSQPVVILPIGSVEDHGRHLPIDTDNFLIWSICEAAAQAAPGEILLMPQIPFGFETHHMDFPGAIDIHSDHLDLATKSGVAISTIRRMESFEGEVGARTSTLSLVKRALEKGGIEFLNDDQPAVRMKKK